MASTIRVFKEKLFRLFFPQFFGHDIRANIKSFFALFSDFFPFFPRTIHVFLEKLFRAFFPPILWSRYSCEYKKRFFAFFSEDFSQHFFSHYSCVSGKIVSCIFLSPFLGHDIRLNIKNVFSHLFPTIFSQHLFSHSSCFSGKIVSFIFCTYFLVTIFV